MTNCSEVDKLLPEYVLGVIDEAGRGEVEQHLAEPCSHCQTLLDEYHEAASMLSITDPIASTPQSPPPELKAELMRRVRDGELAAPAQQPAPANLRPRPATSTHRSKRWHLLAYATVAAVAFAVGSQLLPWASDPPPAALTAAEREERYRQRMQEIERSFDTGQVRLATASSAGQVGSKLGAVVWDAQTSEVHLIVFDLAHPSQGNILQAWVEDEQGGYSPIGTVQPNDRQEATHRFAAPPSSGTPRAVVVTEEARPVTSPLSPGQSPTGALRLVAPFTR